MTEETIERMFADEVKLLIPKDSQISILQTVERERYERFKDDVKFEDSIKREMAYKLAEHIIQSMDVQREEGETYHQYRVELMVFNKTRFAGIIRAIKRFVVFAVYNKDVL